MVTPSVLKTSSNGPENLASRSPIRNRTGVGRSSKEYARLRACWEVEVPSERSALPDCGEPAAVG
jgi:hypothetical protein